jgi:hypothetical protein
LSPATITRPNENPHPFLRNGGTFWDNFIGTTDNASSCTIVNRDAVPFHYDRKNKRLLVSAVEPLIIVNKALGYTIEYRLGAPGEKAEYREGAGKGDLRSGDCRHTRHIPDRGISSDSLRHYRKVLREPDTVIHTLNNYDTLVTVNADQTRSFYFVGIFTVGYGNAKLGIPNTSSSMELTSPVSLQIEENGSYSPLQILLLKGAWAKTQTIANLLPSDYTPPPLP